MDGGEFSEALALMRAGVDALLQADVTGLEGSPLVVALREFETQRRRLEAVDHKLLMQVNDSRLPAARATTSVAGVVADVLTLDPGDARRRAVRAFDCGPRRSLTGEPLEPSLAAVADAVTTGAVSPAQLDVIVEAVERIPDCAPPAAWTIVEQVLVEAARHEPPRLLRRTAHELLTRLDPDGAEPEEERKQRERAFGLVAFPDGWSRPSGRWSPELTACVQAVLDGLAAPQPADDAGTPDPRTATQRRHDAMLEAVREVLGSSQLPGGGGVPVTIMATTTMTALTRVVGRSGNDPADLPRLGLAELAADAGLDLAEVLASSSSGLAVLGHGATVSARSLLAMACEAEIVPVVFGDGGGVLAYGRTRRLASREQRLALAARDGGCCFPGCDRPAAWCEAHHVVEWIKGGPTDLDNLCLLCTFHHRWFESAGWRVQLVDGVPTWTPPAWLDATQAPRRNTAHHLPRIEFRQPGAA